jgi:hypothetical protein
MGRRVEVTTRLDDLRIALPDDLAPALRERVDALLRQVPLARRRTDRGPGRTVFVLNRCVFCHRPGKLGSHHDDRGDDLVWAHAKCHRRHHRAHRRTARGDRWWRTRVAAPQPTA